MFHSLVKYSLLSILVLLAEFSRVLCIFFLIELLRVIWQTVFMKLFCSVRQKFLLLVGFCVALLAIAYYMQYAMGVRPCPLCLLQRGVIWVLMLMSLVAVLHNPVGMRRKLYAAANLVLAMFGLALAGRQVFLQLLPPLGGGQCLPEISYLFSHLPWSQAIMRLFEGTADCSDVAWHFLGLTIPMWTFLFFLFVFFFSVSLYHKD
jgi:disulfide bond formation protein DsbB